MKDLIKNIGGTFYKFLENYEYKGWNYYEGFLKKGNEVFEYAMLEKGGYFLDPNGNINENIDLFSPVLGMPLESMNEFYKIDGLVIPFFTNIKEGIELMLSTKELILKEFPNCEFIAKRKFGLDFYDKNYISNKKIQITKSIHGLFKEIDNKQQDFNIIKSFVVGLLNKTNAKANNKNSIIIFKSVLEFIRDKKEFGNVDVFQIIIFLNSLYKSRYN